MRAAVYYRNNDVRLEERPVPALQAGDLLVQMEACGLCAGETAEVYQLPRGPRVIGHEPTGTVVAVGEGVTRFRIGDRIFAHHHVPCMACHQCLRGRYTLCEHFHQTHLDPGGFAEYFRVPAEIVRLDTHRLPESLSFEEGTVIEPMACCYKGLRITPTNAGDTLAVVGAGFMGLCFVQLACLTPAAQIVSIDRNEWRLAHARAMGATKTLNPSQVDAVAEMRELTEGRGADAVFLTSPSRASLDLAVSLVAPGGTLHINAPPEDPGPHLSGYDLFFRELHVNSAYSASHLDTRAVLDLLAAGRVRAAPLITHRFGLDGVGKGIELILSRGQSLKVVIRPSLTTSPALSSRESQTNLPKEGLPVATGSSRASGR
jgi:L-iditol 2-dehydrogenase